MSISESVRTRIAGSSWIRKMFEEGGRLRAIHGEENVYDFTLGNPSVEPPEAFAAALKELATAPLPGMHRYMNNAGYDETRAAVAAFLAKDSVVTPEGKHVVMTCGAGGALNVVLKTVLNAGEEVMILAPYFVEYKFYIDNHGGVTTEAWTNKETFELDIPAIEKAITAKTKAIIVNSPNNPTGVIYSRESLLELGKMLAKKEEEFGRQIYLISDQPYARLAYDGNRVPDIFEAHPSTIIVTSHSKDLALPGERIGYLAANPKMPGVAEFIDGAIFCNRILGFVNAPALMQRLVANLQHASVDIGAYQEKRDILYNHLTGLGFTMNKPGGGFYLFVKSPIEDEMVFIAKAQEQNILLVPGRGFGAPGYFRIAYCVDKGMIQRSLPAWNRLAAAIGLSA